MRLACGISAIAVFALSLNGAVRAADTATQRLSANAQKSQLETVVVEAERLKQLETQIRQFTSSALVQPFADSLLRWTTPVCPLVGGLPRDRAEYILAAVSKVAREAQAPLAGEQCKANLFVIVTWQPDLLLKAWWQRDSSLFNANDGSLAVSGFLRSKAPIRVWYNFGFAPSDKGPTTDLGTVLSLTGTGIEPNILSNMPTIQSNYCRASRLCRTGVQALSSVIVVVDKNQIKNLNMGQLGDYVAMVGLADVHSEADTGSTPSILGLFQKTGTAPREMSAWDHALLYALYTTDQGNVMQMTQIKSTMLNQLLQ
jgi:hypothetical protein